MRSEEVILAPAQHAALQLALDVPLAYLEAGSTLTSAALAGAARFEPYRHYPQHDVVARQHGTRFFYHGHSALRVPREEHGHFHLFVEHGEQEAAGGPRYSHLVGLSLDSRGQPLRWFTTNRWVTGEHWYGAAQLQALLPGLRWHSGGRLAPVARWLTAMVTLFQTDIAGLLSQRDAVLTQRAAGQPLASQFEDRGLDVITQCDAALATRWASPEFFNLTINAPREAQ